MSPNLPVCHWMRRRGAFRCPFQRKGLPQKPESKFEGGRSPAVSRPFNVLLDASGQWVGSSLDAMAQRVEWQSEGAGGLLSAGRRVSILHKIILLCDLMLMVVNDMGSIC